jgi:uncharacterized heparinase superfamily protein
MGYVSKTALLFNTVRHLRPIQIRYRLKYFIRNRVGKFPSLSNGTTISRTFVTIHKDELDRVIASHDGYIKRVGVKHTRDISLSENGGVIVNDIQNEEGVANFHFAPDIKLNISGNQLESDGFNIVFQNNGSLELKPSYYSPEFNKRIENIKLEVSFHGKLTTHIFVK